MNSSYFGLFFTLKAVWKNFGAVGMLSCFELMKRPDFGTNCWLGKRGNLD